MKRKQLSLTIHGVLAMTLLATMPALAQEQAAAADGQKTTTLGSITVTARKREETLQEVPVAVTAFTADTLDKLNIEDLADLDAQVPNLTIYAARGSSSTLTAYIRGVGQSDPLWGVDPGVGLYLDDVYIARPQGALLDVFDVERIEVLRGPQGTLYGKNTIGGAIKYISRGLPLRLQRLRLGHRRQLRPAATSRRPIGGSVWAAASTCVAASRSPASTATASARTSITGDAGQRQGHHGVRGLRWAPTSPTTSTCSSRSTASRTSPACAARRC